MIHYESQAARKPAKSEIFLLPTLSVAVSIGLQILAVYAALRYALINLAPEQPAANQQIFSFMGAVLYGVVAVIAYPRLSAQGGVTYKVPPETVLFAPGQRVRAVKPLFPVAKGTLGIVTGKDVRKRHSKNGDLYFVTWEGGVGLAVKPSEIEKLD